MDASAIFATLGGIALLVALFGGGIKPKRSKYQLYQENTGFFQVLWGFFYWVFLFGFLSRLHNAKPCQLNRRKHNW
ncbi:MAG: hypothetical protein QME21_18655 [Anaerolineales bacterium]|nr:hypothetical protein [Anaerolineales bacterium]